jgi:hypothetical protein
MFNISANTDDTIVMVWTHEDMAALLEKSSDLRDVLTRALTAAIVGKVVAFTASKKGTTIGKEYFECNAVGCTHLSNGFLCFLSIAATEKQSTWWSSPWSSSEKESPFLPPSSVDTNPIPVADYEEEDLPKKVKLVNQKSPSFALPESSSS